MRRLRPAVIGCACLLLVACGSTTKQASIRRDVALRLANTSDGIAKALTAGDGCLAQRRARGLRSQVAAAVAAGSIPRELASDAQVASTRLVSTITCTPPPPAPIPPPPPAPAGCDEHDAHGKGGEHGHGHKKECG